MEEMYLTIGRSGADFRNRRTFWLELAAFDEILSGEISKPSLN
jgi:hypothetical protein